MTGELRIDHGVCSGTFSLDGETHEVENNIWVIGDDTDCVVIDAPHNVDAILEVVAGRQVQAVLCTHAHDDHVRVAPQLAQQTRAQVRLHPDEMPLWRLVHRDLIPDGLLADGMELEFGDAHLQVLHTPGHSPGGVCFYLPELRTVFTGDTLFKGGPGATGRSFSDHAQLVESIRNKLLVLSDDTVVNPGHGESTTIGAEAEGLCWQ